MSGKVLGVSVAVAVFGTVWFAYANSFVDNSLSTWGHVADLDCHTDDEGSLLCAVIFEFVDSRGRTVQVAEGVSSNVHPNIDDSVKVLYHEADPRRTATRGRPWGIWAGPLLLLLGLGLGAGNVRPKSRDLGWRTAACWLLAQAGWGYAIHASTTNGFDFGWLTYGMMAACPAAVALGLGARNLLEESSWSFRAFLSLGPVALLAAAICAVLAAVAPERAEAWLFGSLVGSLGLAPLHLAMLDKSEVFFSAHRERRSLAARIEAARTGRSEEALVQVTHVGERVLAARVREQAADPIEVDTQKAHGRVFRPGRYILPSHQIEQRAQAGSGYRDHESVQWMVVTDPPVETDAKPVPNPPFFLWATSAMAIALMLGVSFATVYLAKPEPASTFRGVPTQATPER